jgi:hypothetical protein
LPYVPYERARYVSQQPDFAWIPERKGLGKLLSGSQARKDAAAGRSLRFFVYPWGIQWIDGDEEVTARWEDVWHVWQRNTRHYANGVPVATEYRYTLRLASGVTKAIEARLRPGAARTSEATRLASRPGITTEITIEQLGRLLETGVTRTQLPQAISSFRAGHPLSFGPLTVSHNGISAGDNSLPWNEIQEVRTREGYVSVRRAGKWLSWKRAPVGDIPNYFVFDALVRSILQQRPPVR